jgi:hypothetical protein
MRGRNRRRIEVLETVVVWCAQGVEVPVDFLQPVLDCGRRQAGVELAEYEDPRGARIADDGVGENAFREWHLGDLKADE